MLTFEKALAEIESHPIEEQEELLAILRRRLAERKRDLMVQEAAEDRNAFRQGKLKVGTLADLRQDLEN